MPWIVLLVLGLLIAGPAGALAFGVAGLAALAAVALGGLALLILHAAELGTEGSVWAGAAYWIAKGPAMAAVVFGIPWAAAPGPAAPFAPYPGEPGWLAAAERWLFAGAGWHAAHRIRAAALGFWHLDRLHAPLLAQWALGAGALATVAVAEALAFALGLAALGALERALQHALWGRWPWQALPPQVAWVRRTRRAAWMEGFRRAHPDWARPAPASARAAWPAGRAVPDPPAAPAAWPPADARKVIPFPGRREGSR